ncbi:MAG: hypothetical protein ABIE23_04945 [archaeon]|nr:hypothetical protein [Candidatus Micrarchaeota archaeon]
MNSKGQEFAPFKLLISVIIALAILFIILGIIDHFEKINNELSIKRIVDGVGSAVKTPDGSVITVKDVTLSKNQSFNSMFLASQINFKEECISFDAYQSNSIEISNSNKKITFNSTIRTTVFAMCNSAGLSLFDCDSSCDYCCVVSFGRNPSP